MSDLIERQDALNAIDKAFERSNQLNAYIRAFMMNAISGIKKLPSAQAKHEQTTHSEQGESDKLVSKMGETCVDVTCPNCGCEVHVESAQPDLQPACNQLATDTISRQAAISGAERWLYDGDDNRTIGEMLRDLPSVQPEPCEHADKLERCKFEYINACKTVTYPTPDTNKNDINDAYAVIKALNPIFGDEEF